MECGEGAASGVGLLITAPCSISLLLAVRTGRLPALLVPTQTVPRRGNTLLVAKWSERLLNSAWQRTK